MNQQVIVFSPAKINLFLRVLGKRSDGYHQIASLFQTLNFGDTLFLAKGEKDHFSSTYRPLEEDPSNLVIRARELFRKETRCKEAVEIHLTKRIPLGSGMGGGSSNAAAILWGLNELFFQKKIPEKLLRDWSRELGSDVPSFFSSGFSLCTGRGEIVESFERKKNFSAWIATPLWSLASEKVFGAFCTTDQAFLDPNQLLKGFLENHPVYLNDLEKAAVLVQPKMLDLKKNLLSLGFQHVFMTGSGSSFVCLGEKIENPVLEGISFVLVKAIQRNSTEWYSDFFKKEEK